MPQTFDCPKCGAPVKYERPTSAAKSTVRCDYCHSQLIAPNELAGQQAQIIRVHFGSSKFPKWILLVLAIPLIGLFVGLLAAFGSAFFSVSRAIKEPAKPVIPNTPRKESTNTFANVLLEFGSEGIGPGMFNDARSIGVDGAGRIYVAEYTGGRVQVFDPAG
jgi:DNA-directed RNA polymerase subunit RPC12/RpoP